MAGESAQEQYERVRAARRARQRDLRPLLFGVTAVVAALFAGLFEFTLGMWWLGVLVGVMMVLPRALAPPQREVAWRRGAQGERIVGAVLDSLAGNQEGVVVLHDRRLPRSRANLDHLVVTRSGVYVIDAKHYQGRLTVRGSRLLVAGRDRSRLLELMARQERAVSSLLSAAGYGQVPLTTALCFVGVGWPWLFRPRQVAGVRLCAPGELADLLEGDTGPAPVAVDEVAAVLAHGLPPAAARTPTTAADTVERMADNTPPRDLAGRDGEGSPGTPVCSCGAPMRRRVRRRDGAAFWGCSTFPACRTTSSPR